MRRTAEDGMTKRWSGQAWRVGQPRKQVFMTKQVFITQRAQVFITQRAQNKPKPQSAQKALVTYESLVKAAFKITESMLAPKRQR